MQAVIQPLLNLNEYQEIRSRLPENRGVLQLSGCIESQKAHVMYGLFEGMRQDEKQKNANCLIIAENDLKAKELYEDYRFYDRDVLFYPAKDLIFFQADIHGNLLTKQRMQVIAALLQKKGVTVITSMGGCMDYLLPLSVIEQHVLHFKNDSVLDLGK
ncbi:MAG: transcription-repair coupling factor, partial [Blautia coccoides]